MVLAGCQTNSGFNQYKNITTAQSMLKIEQFEDNGPSPAILRKQRRCVFEELWTWNGGELIAFQSAPGCYMVKSVNSAKSLFEDYQNWNYLKRIDLQLSLSSIVEGKDIHGRPMAYGVGESASAGKTCFVASRSVGRHQEEKGANIFVYLCENNAVTSSSEMEDKGRQFLETVFIR